MLTKGRAGTDTPIEFSDRLIHNVQGSLFLIIDRHPAPKAKKLLSPLTLSSIVYICSFLRRIRPN
jgi:hypothetical protein